MVHVTRSWTFMTARTAMRVKTFTTDGSMLFGTYEVTEASHPKYKGTIRITGGSGKFQKARLPVRASW